MLDVRTTLELWLLGHSLRTIARHLGADRKTVRRVVALAREHGLDRDRTCSTQDLVRIAALVSARPRSPRRTAAWWRLCAHKDQIARWLLVAPRLPLRRVHTLLQREGVVTAYTTLRRFAMREIGWRPERGAKP